MAVTHFNKSMMKAGGMLGMKIHSVSKQMAELTWELESLCREFEKFKSDLAQEAESKNTFDNQASLQEQLRINELKNSVDRLLRLKEVLAILPVKKSKFWDGVKKGIYPAPVYSLGPKVPTWKLSSILQLVNGEEVPYEN